MQRGYFIISALLLLLFCMPVSAQSHVAMVRGQVLDKQTRETLPFATVHLKGPQAVLHTLADDDGRFSFSKVAPGSYTLEVTYTSFNKFTRTLEVVQDPLPELTVYLTPISTLLGEVVVTAEEARDKSSTSRITKEAIQHLQPTSFADLLELLPGGKSVNPSMTTPNLFQMRESQMVSSGTTNRNMRIASLGIGIQIDGVSLDNDAALQGMVGKGVDIRSISTDEIESVEIIRGLPSVEYGNVSGGVVRVNRISSATPYRMRFKADMYGQLYAFGKGLNVTDDDVLNLGLDYLYNKADPSDPYTTYKRLTGSLRWNAKRLINDTRMVWNLSADYTGSFDQDRPNEDNQFEDNKFRADFSRAALSSRAEFYFDKRPFLRNIKFTASASQEWSQTEEFHRESGGYSVPATRDEGEGWGYALPNVYVSHRVIDGKPLALSAKLSSNFSARTGAFNHVLNLGADWQYTKNLGEGHTFDPALPPYGATLRPRKFKDIPALNRLGLYAESVESAVVGDHLFTLTSGVRLAMMLGLDKEYHMHNRFYADPRFNLMWLSPKFGPGDHWRVDLTGSAGLMTRMPTLLDLFPNKIYEDFSELYVYTPERPYAYYRTIAWDNTNYDLEPARNFKWEVRTGIYYKGNKLYVTYFQEKMNNAFRPITYWKRHLYREFDRDDFLAKGKPENIEDIALLQEHSRVGFYTYSGNGTKVRKQGIEFQLFTNRIRSIYTKFTANGAWYRTSYLYTYPFYRSRNIFGGAHGDYIGKYDNYPDGYVRDLLRTNFMFDTQVPRIGMIFSSSFQCTWMTGSERVKYDGRPSEYIDPDGIVHPFTDKEMQGPLKALVDIEPESNFTRKKVPFEMMVNIKMSKSITKYAHASLFVNRILQYAPDYMGDLGILVRRSHVSPYFGMEIRFEL